MKRVVSLTVNREACESEVEPRTLLVHFLREQLGLTGTHVGCVVGECGACSVLVDGALAITKPGVQKPHCRAQPFTNAS